MITERTRRERSDAKRNRQAILAATEELLATHGPHVSVEQVAAAAGVGKGTVFHRFGSRAGLMRALMIERAQALEQAVRTGPPPLGEGAPGRDRLLAFLDAVIEVISRNKNLLAELAYTPADMAAAAPENEHGNEHGNEHDGHPVYDFWHGHISALVAAQRPDADADTIAHLLLGALHSEPILAQLAAEGTQRLTAALRAITCAILDVNP
jgi:AcrR family transcriptional regulator